jgi:hypothetical protein
MAIFSVTDVAFAGYRLLRERPRAIVCWAAFQAVAYLLGVLLVAVLSAPQKANLEILQHAQSVDPRQALAAMVAVGPIFVVILIFMVAVSAVLQTAVYRAFLKPQEKRWGYLRLGRDEARMAALMAILGVLLVVFVLIMAFVLGMGVALGNLLPQALHGLVDFLAFAVMFAAIAYMFTRFSLAAPATFVERRLQLGRSWRMTKGHVWQLVGAYLLMYVTLIMMLLLVVVVCAALMGATALLSGGDLQGVLTALRGESAAALPLPMLLLNLLFSIFQLWLVPAAAAVQIGPSAESYREIVVLETEARPAFA